MNHLFPLKTPFAEIVIGGDTPDTAEKLPERKDAPVQRDPVRERFAKMRQIARESNYIPDANANLYFNREQRARTADVFYKQALFMQDFTDEYTAHTPFSMYYPHYQAMSHEQLRYYFTWRAKVRDGEVKKAPLSYAFLYVYELINLIGAESPPEALKLLIDFWRVFRGYDTTIDKYAVRWVKEFYIYYELPACFRAFLIEYNVDLHDPNAFFDADENNFALYAAISKYDVKASPFYTRENAPLIEACFSLAMERMRLALTEASFALDEFIFNTARKKKAWYPFDGALFRQKRGQRDRYIALSQTEIYSVKNNLWSYQTASECNRVFIGYIMKQTEAALRAVMGFKPGIAVKPDSIGPDIWRVLRAAGVKPEEIICNAVRDYYAEINKTVVAVDFDVLEKVRREALITQEKLIVEEETRGQPILPRVNEPSPVAVSLTVTAPQVNEIASPAASSLPAETQSTIAVFINTLAALEREAVSTVLNGDCFSAFAAKNNIMPEVLVDSINQKAFDTIRDNVLEYGDTVIIYEDYIDELSDLLCEACGRRE